MSHYKNIILNKLLDKYEKSKSLYAKSNRRVIVKINELKEYNIEDYETKRIFHDVVQELKEEQLIDYVWQRYEKGNILQEIWLNKENVKKAYEIVNRIDVKKINEVLQSLLKEYQFNQDWIERYRKDMLKNLVEKHKMSSLFPFQFAKDILKVLKEIDCGFKQEILKRVLSMKCFGNSKYFEQNIEPIIVRIIKVYLLDKENYVGYHNDDILLEVGISRYPEIFEFCGDLEYFIKNEKIECKKETMRKLC